MTKRELEGVFLLLPAAFALCTASCQSQSNAPQPLSQSDLDYQVVENMVGVITEINNNPWLTQTGTVNASGACTSGSWSVNSTNNATYQAMINYGLEDCSYTGTAGSTPTFTGSVQYATPSNSYATFTSSSLTATGSISGTTLSGYSGCALAATGSAGGTVSGTLCGRPFGPPGASSSSSGGSSGSCNTSACNDYEEQCTSNPNSQAPCYCAAACDCACSGDTSCAQSNAASAASLGTTCQY